MLLLALILQCNIYICQAGLQDSVPKQNVSISLYIYSLTCMKRFVIYKKKKELLNLRLRLKLFFLR